MAGVKKKQVFKWVVEVKVDPIWVADGFNPDADRFKDMILTEMLGYASDHEVEVKILSRPNQRAVAREQGFKNVQAMKKA